jgi:MFS family permease
MRERLRVLRHHDFRNVWLAQSTSAIGDGVVIVALALFVTELTGDPTQVGIVLAAYLAPLIAFLLIGGVWADRLPRQRVMLTADTTMAERIPAHALSRASAWEWMGSLALLPLGYLLAGPAADASSATTVMVTGAILTAIAIAIGLIPRDTRMLRGLAQRQV